MNFTRGISTIAFAAMGLSFGSAAVASGPPAGVWANPHNSVHVAFKRCGLSMCGTVVWANEKAQADAARGGEDHLVGRQLFHDFVEDGPNRWSGQVLVPDIGQSVAGTIKQVDAQTLVGEGCVMAGFGCKTQTWKRISR